MTSRACRFVLTTMLLTGSAALSAAETPPPTVAAWDSGTVSFLPRSLQANPSIDVIIITEMTAAGKALTPASPSHPAYYLAGDSGVTEIGDTYAGERPPKDQILEATMVRTLAANGYLPADATHPASLYLYFRWGSFNQIKPVDDTSSGNLPQAPDHAMQLNLIERAGLVAGTPLALEILKAMRDGTLQVFSNRDSKTRFIMDQIYSNRYFVVASAYDYAATAQHRLVLLWRTRISTDSQGLKMDRSIPSIVQTAGPLFGRETAGPVRLTRQVVPDGSVILGTPTVKP